MGSIKQVYDASAQKCYPIVKLDCITDTEGIYDASSGIDVIVKALKNKELTVSALYVNDGTDENDVTIKNNFFEIENIIKIDGNDIVSYDKPLKIYKTNSKTFSLLDSSCIQVGYHNIREPYITEPFGIAKYTDYRLESTDKSFGLLCNSGKFVSGIYSDGKSIKIQNVDAGRPIGMYTDFGPYDVFFKRKIKEDDISRDASVFSISTIAGPNISQVKSYVDTFVHGILSIRPEDRTKDTRISLHVDTSLGVTKGGYLDIKYDASTKINIYSEYASGIKSSRIGINYDNSTKIDIYSEYNNNIKQSHIGLNYDASTNVNMFALGSPDGRYGSLYINSDDSTKINMSSVINIDNGRRESSIGILSDASTKINMSSVINIDNGRRESSIGILSDASTKINMNTRINGGIRESSIGILSDASTKIEMNTYSEIDTPNSGRSNLGVYYDTSTKTIISANSNSSRIGINYDNSTNIVIYSKRDKVYSQVYHHQSGLNINAKDSKIAMTSSERGSNRTSKLEIMSDASGYINILSEHSAGGPHRNSITSVGALLKIDGAVQFNKAISTSVYAPSTLMPVGNSYLLGIYDDNLEGYNDISINNRPLCIVKNTAQTHYMKHFIIYNRGEGVSFYLKNNSTAYYVLQPNSFYLVVLGNSLETVSGKNVYTNNLILPLNFTGSL